MERILLRRLNYHLETAGARPNSICGFLDISEASDVLPRFNIISALRSLSFLGRPVACVRAFLGNRTMQVRVHSVISEQRSIARGVPQDTVLSPLLFSVAMFLLPANAAVRSVPFFFIDMAVYADDVSLWGTARWHRQRPTVQ